MVIRLIPKEIETGTAHVWRIWLDKPSGSLAELLSSDENKRVERFKQPSDRNRFVRAHGAMRSILGRYLGKSGDILKIVTGAKGKPSLEGPDSAIEFNLTHCEDMALLAVTEGLAVGIDLERIRERPMQLKIAKRLFLDSIYQRLLSLPSDQIDEAFLRHWTELEACAKCAGDGIFSNENERDDIKPLHFNPEHGWIACIAVKGLDASALELRHFLYRN